MTKRKPRAQKTRSIRHPKWDKEVKMDAAYLAGLISHEDHALAKQWITEMREGSHPDAHYGIPDYTLSNPRGETVKTPTGKFDLATFSFANAPGGHAFWSNILYAIGSMEMPTLKPTNRGNRIQTRINYLHDIGVLKTHTKEFIFKTFVELEQGAYPEAHFEPSSPDLATAFNWELVPPGRVFWNYIDFIDKKFNQ